MKISTFAKFKDIFDDLIGKNRFSKFDFVVLKTMMMLAAVDGEISADEIDSFRSFAEKCRGYGGESFDKLWDAAVHSAGYLLLQTRFVEQEDLVKAFVKEAEKDFVGEIALDEVKDRELAFASLEQMAAADGDFSDVERACVRALEERVKQARNQAIAERYPRAVAFDR